LRGDERYLPARDRGPARAYLRDLVDSRRGAAEFLLPGLLLVFVLSLIPLRGTQLLSTVLWLTVIVSVVTDSVLLVRRAKRGLRERFPDAGTRGTTAYVVLRSMQLRRFRVPPPRSRADPLPR
jgi:hypothetical protein